MTSGEWSRVLEADFAGGHIADEDGREGARPGTTLEQREDRAGAVPGLVVGFEALAASPIEGFVGSRVLPAEALLRRGARAAKGRAYVWSRGAGVHKTLAVRRKRPSHSGRMGGVGGREVRDAVEIMWFASFEPRRSLRACVVVVAWSLGPLRRDLRQMVTLLRRRIARVSMATILRLLLRWSPRLRGAWRRNVGLVLRGRHTHCL